MSDPWETGAEQPPPPPRGFSRGAVVALAMSLVVLAVAGLAIGWFVAGEDTGRNAAQDPTPGPSATAQRSTEPSPEASTAAPVVSVSPTVAPPVSAPPGKTMPNLTTIDFHDARNQALELKMSVTVVFDGVGNVVGQVTQTEPAPGLAIKSGINVKLHVVGPAPTFAMPDVVKQGCTAAKAALVAEGLRIDKYPSGKNGTVQSTNPVAGATVTWGDLVDIFCLSIPASPAA